MCAHLRNITTDPPPDKWKIDFLSTSSKRTEFFLCLFKNVHPSTDLFALEFTCIEIGFRLAMESALALPQEVVDVSALFQLRSGLSSVPGRSIHDP
jgi:hypothetical protein